MDIPPHIKSFDHLIKEIKKPRREYEKKYIGTTKGYTINKKGKRREQAHDILCGLYTDLKIKEVTLLIIQQEYDNYVKIYKNPAYPQR